MNNKEQASVIGEADKWEALLDAERSEVTRLTQELKEAQDWIDAKCSIAGCWRSKYEQAESKREKLRVVLRGQGRERKVSLYTVDRGWHTWQCWHLWENTMLRNNFKCPAACNSARAILEGG